LAAYSVPRARAVFCPASTRTPSASVVPIAVVGMSIAASASPRRSPETQYGCPTKGASQSPTTDSAAGKPHTRRLPLSATVTSAAAKASAGRRMRFAQRAASAPPSASPSMNAVSTSAAVHTVLPRTRPNARNHRTSKSSAAAPEAKKASGSRSASRMSGEGMLSNSCRLS